MLVEIASKEYEVKDISWLDNKGDKQAGKVAEQKAFLDTGDKHWEVFYISLKRIKNQFGDDKFVSYDEGVYELEMEDNFYIDKYKKPAMVRNLILKPAKN